MFDCHRAEITVMQFTGHSLPVHQSVTVTRDFNPVPYCQPDSPTPMEYALPPSLEWHVWRGRRSIYYTEYDPKQSDGEASEILELSGIAEYPFITITSRSTLACRGST